jgi:pimeloyl-ACP methyl ester carboxylesterase
MVSAPMPMVLAAHGLGLGPWLYDAWRPAFEAAGFGFRALTLPGHGGDEADPSLGDVVDFLDRAVNDTSGPVILVAHSFSGLAAQMLLTHRTLHAAVLICPLPPGFQPPTWTMLRHAPAALAAILRGRPYRPSREAWASLGYSRLTGTALDSAIARSGPWPSRLCLDLARSPSLCPSSLETPVLVAVGGADPILPPNRARIVGDLFEGVVWKYDELAHSPMLEPGGERMLRDILGFCAAPVRPLVIESEGFRPDEGAGHTLRRQRRGERIKKRSAYGQKPAAR